MLTQCIICSDESGGDIRGHRLYHGEHKQHRHRRSLQARQQGTTCMCYYIVYSRFHQTVFAAQKPDFGQAVLKKIDRLTSKFSCLGVMDPCP